MNTTTLGESWKTIVVATDLTGTSEAAISLARMLASTFGSRVVLAHGVDPVSYANLQNLPATVTRDLTAEAQKALDELGGQFVSEGIASNTIVRQQTVTQLLLDVIRQYNAGLVVLGTRGASGAGPLLVGSVAEELVRQSPCPVLAVAADTLANGCADLSCGQILVPVEGNPASLRAVSTAKSLAEKLGLGLLLLHAESPAGCDPCSKTMAQIQFPQSDAKVPVRCLVKEGRPAEVIQQVSSEYPVGLIVLGVNRESRSVADEQDRLHFGTAYTVLATAKVPVLCVPPGADEDSGRKHEIDEPCCCS